MIKTEDLPTSNVDDKEELVALAAEASKFLLEHRKWCKGITASYFDRGFSKVAVFYFEIEPLPGQDPRIWVIVGDVPPAYIDFKSCPNGAAALDGYVAEMLAWAAAVKRGESTRNLIPVFRRGSLARVEESKEFAEMLESRMKFIKTQLLVQWPEELKVRPLDES